MFLGEVWMEYGVRKSIYIQVDEEKNKNIVSFNRSPSSTVA
jgi:hypothetical protein